MANFFLQMFFRSQNVFQPRFSIERDYYLGGNPWKCLCSMFENPSPRLLLALRPGHQARCFVFKTKVDAVDRKEPWTGSEESTCILTVLSACGPEQVILFLSASVSPVTKGGLWARLSLRSQPLGEILRLNLLLPASQTSLWANIFAPLKAMFPHIHHCRYFIPEVTISSLTYPISFKVSSFCFEVQRKRRLCIMRMAPLKCFLRSCKALWILHCTKAIVMQMCSKVRLQREHFHGSLLYVFYYS